MAAELDLNEFVWMNAPQKYSIGADSLTIQTEANTDFWQRTYYNFRHDNAPTFTIKVAEQQFSFSVHTAWNPAKLFDQCGVVLYQDSDNWFKATVEYTNQKIARLGSVVTNLGYSDWATTDIDSSLHQMAYRLSRRGQDFLIENSQDGKVFHQMRIFHMHKAMEEVNIGVYASSPLDSSMETRFTDFKLEECQWELYTN